LKNASIFLIKTLDSRLYFMISTINLVFTSHDLGAYYNYKYLKSTITIISLNLWKPSLVRWDLGVWKHILTKANPSLGGTIENHLAKIQGKMDPI
jgi:hypothetical protein